MSWKAVYGMTLALLLMSMLTLAINIQPAKAEPFEPPAMEWNKTYGGALREVAYSVVETSNGGYAIAGITSSFGAGDYDFWLVKTDTKGNMMWNRTYGGSQDDKAYCVLQTSDGGYILAGHTTSFGAGSYDFWLVKTDAHGNMMWDKTYGGRVFEGAKSVVETSDGGYALTGWTQSFGPGDADFWLVRTDVHGNMMWNRTYGGAGSDDAYCVVQTNDGGYAIAGYTVPLGADFADFWLVKTDSSGNMMWNRTYGGERYEWARSVQQTSDGGYIVAGYTISFGAGWADFWLVKTDAYGNMMWNKTYGGVDSDDAYAVLQIDDGGYVIAGYTCSFGAGSIDFWLVKTDANGVMVWNRTYGGVESDAAHCMSKTSDGGYALAGSTWSFGAGDADFWLVKVAGPPEYTLTIDSSPTGVTFTVDDSPQTTAWAGTYRENTSVGLVMPETHTIGEARYYWDQWSDGETRRSRIVTITTNIILTAYYTGPYYQLTVTSSPITGITFTINRTPKTTPYTEWLAEGSYTLVMPETHNGYVWSHWLEDGDTSKTKTITLPGTTWTGIYMPAAVGGEMTLIKVDKPPLALTRVYTWIGLASVIISTITVSVIYVRHRKKQQT